MKGIAGQECPRDSTSTRPPPPPPPPSTTPPPPGSCMTESGPDSGKECTFPFQFGDVTYNECTYDANEPGDTEPWCSTLTDSDGVHVGGQGNWGWCSSDCPAEATPPPPTCEDTAKPKKCARKCKKEKKCRKNNLCKNKCKLTCNENFPDLGIC